MVIKADVSPYAVFSDISLPKGFTGSRGGGSDGRGKRRRHGTSVAPEMYARPDGTVYACGMFFQYSHYTCRNRLAICCVYLPLHASLPFV